MKGTPIRAASATASGACSSAQHLCFAIRGFSLQSRLPKVGEGVWTDGDDCAFLGAGCWVGEADDVLVVGCGGLGRERFTVLAEYGLVCGCGHCGVVVVVGG